MWSSQCPMTDDWQLISSPISCLMGKIKRLNQQIKEFVAIYSFLYFSCMILMS